ncbi:type II toxin-antitoxin system ParD family antitoxin [Rhizobium sp. XQZ8]|uniref:ribbon-helix-helix domain-containing protein n=1 Tax=Rhizobium populisoli TaxID=2859785 RepID=UPI001C674452|nr:type II toxin-antitoxin system ParD family antitoxin [Rhizobium populisoli]MBW6423640.1 type II toxin-antitoxin system ParD family antitoxin [Rhizobium populisoli]
MASVEKVSISLTSQHAEILREAVASGAYATSSEVVREAMRDWAAKWVQRRGDMADLRKMWEDGKASGTATAVDFDRTLEEARAELAALKRNGN